MTSLAMVYGGGGPFGIAFNLGVADALEAAGLPVGDVPALGTSAGSWVAAAKATGITWDRFAAVDDIKVPNFRGGYLAGIARNIFGDMRHPNVTASVVEVGVPRRKLLNGGTHDLADIIAASSAVPGLFAPHRVDGQLYMDGGMWSAVSVDAASHADVVIVVAPLAGRVLFPAGVVAGGLLTREVRKWRKTNPTSWIGVIVPDGTTARHGGRYPWTLFDPVVSAGAYPHAWEQTRRWVTTHQESLARHGFTVSDPGPVPDVVAGALAEAAAAA